MPDGQTPSSVAPPSLGNRTIRGAGWVLVWRMTTRLLGFVNTLVLVRLLAPADFGLVALATTFSQIVEALSSIGVNDALVRETETDRALYDTGFTMNLLRGTAMSAVIVAGAIPVAGFFGDPRLTNIQYILAATVFLAALENIGVVDFRRGMAFDKEFQLALLPRFSGIVVAIGCAIVFQNYWALIAGLTATRVLRTIVSYWIHPYRPGITLLAWRRLIGFSFWTWMATLVGIARDRIDTLVIGRMLGPMKIGIYAVGWEIGSLTTTELVEPFTIALFAGFAAGRRSGADVADGYFRAIAATFLLTLPLGCGLAILALPAISLLFGSAWLDAVPLVQIFALVAMMKVIANFSGVLLNAHGLVHVQFRIALAALIVRVAMLFALIVPFGLIGAAAGAIVGIAFEEALYLVVCFRRFSLRARDLARATWRSFAAAGLMGAALMLCGFGQTSAIGNTMPALADILGGTVLGGIVYCAGVLALWTLSGRPNGAETMVLGVLHNALGRFLPARRRPGV